MAVMRYQNMLAVPLVLAGFLGPAVLAALLGL
jgi:hypothetical protein